MKKVLLADKLPEQCVTMLQEAGLEVVNRPGLAEPDLKEAAKGVHGIICRSGVKITAGVLDGADQLEAVCRAGVGVDNIDVPAASRKGVVVMNTPGGNTLSTAEHAFALILALARKIGPAYLSMREGRWEKKKLTGFQLAGSTLGVVGLGRIGQTVAKRAVAFEMTVLAYDPYVGRDAASKIGVQLVDNLEDLLRKADFLTLHVPGGDQTKGLIGAQEIALMKKGAYIVNCARGGIVDQDAAMAAVESGHLAGVALDVFPKEPPEDFSFAARDGVLSTPHLGASTDAAQMAVATEAAELMVDALTRRHFRNAVNVSSLPPEEMKAVQPYCDLAAKLGKLVAQLASGRPESVEVACRGAVAQENIEPIVNSGAMGVMQMSLGDSVNIVSTPVLARERGIHITGRSTVGADAGYTDLVTVTLKTDAGEVKAAGTLFGPQRLRIVRIADFWVEITPEGHVLIVFGSDVPGLIGKVGALLGDHGVNIARMAFGRKKAGGNAILALNLDTSCDAATLKRIHDLDIVERTVQVEL